jgi:exopolysaccharide biosynthesis WecB/TagA/CpsF family protein
MPDAHQNITRKSHAWRDILGISVAVMSMEEALSLLKRCLELRQFLPVAFLNANNANIAAKNPELLNAFARFLVLADGVGVDMASLAFHGAMFPANLNGTDLVPMLLRGIERPLKVALIGARLDVAECARDAFQAMCPQHMVSVIADGYFRADDEARILSRLESERPDILLVAMGVPRQELWIADKIRPHHCMVPIAVGALFDIFTGTVPRAPQWMLRLRIEWLYRLWREPQRLWRRYIIGNPVFLASVVRAKLSGTSSARGEAFDKDSGGGAPA